MADAAPRALTARWKAVAPWNVDGGWTVWTDGLTSEVRVCWLGDEPDSGAYATTIANMHNEGLDHARS